MFECSWFSSSLLVPVSGLVSSTPHFIFFKYLHWPASCQFEYTLFFFIGMSNFGAEDERSYIFLRSEAENVLKMFSNLLILCLSFNIQIGNIKTFLIDF